jgi:putative FmdB family regulatory protein
MPTYQYKCSECQRYFEISRSYSASDSKPPKCKRCGSKKTRRVITATFTIGGGETEHSSAHSSGCGSCSSSDCSHCSH